MNSNTQKHEFIELIEANKGIIYKICRSYCDSKADMDDLSQEIVFQLWKSYPGYKQEYKFSTWMYRVSLNVAVSFYRSEKKHRFRGELSESLLIVSPVIEEEEGITELRLLQGFIEELKEIDRSIMLLYLDDRSYREISTVIGISESNVSTRVNRIKEKLRLKFLTIKK